MTSTSHIPVVDLAAVRALDPAGLREAAAAIRDACTSIGFFYISNHGVPTDVLEGAVKAAREFFALSGRGEAACCGESSASRL